MVARGACVVGRGGCAWLWGGPCVVPGGHAWLPGLHGLQGACVVAGGVCIGHDEIWSMSGWYAFYWNAFLWSQSVVYSHQDAVISNQIDLRFFSKISCSVNDIFL